MAVFRWGSWSWPRSSSHADQFIREPIWLGARSRSGVEITWDVAMQASALLCGARVIAEGMAQVPLKLFAEVNEGGRVLRQPAREHPAYRLVADQPNDFMTSFSFRETLTLHAVIAGDGYAFINRKERRPRELLPIAPDDIAPVWNPDRGELVYEFGSGADKASFRPTDILHVHGPSWTGWSGLKSLHLAREALGLSAALEASHADLFANGGRPSGVLSADQPVSQDVVDRVRARWKERFGPNGEGGVAVLDGGWKFAPMTMTAVDAQYIETRRLQIEEVARFLRVFPQMMMQADKTATYASAEQFFLAHVVHTLTPWFVRWEQELKKSLIGYDGDNAAIYPRHSVEGLLRGASKDRAEFFKAALGAGGSPAWMTPDEVRELDNMNPNDDLMARFLATGNGGDGLPAAPGAPPPGPEGTDDAD